MQNKVIFTAIAGLAIVGAWYGLSTNNTNNTKHACDININHSLGETKLCKTPKRVITLEHSFTDAVAAAGVAPVGVSDDGKPQRMPKPIMDVIEGYTSVGTRKAPNLELISKLKPDLIIGDTKRHSSIYKQLSNIAPTIIFDASKGGYQTNVDAAKSIGHALGRGDIIDARINKHNKIMEDNINKIKKIIKDDDIIIASSGPTRFTVQFDNAFSMSSLLHYGLTMPKSLDSIDKSKIWLGAYAPIGFEKLLSINPDFILVGEIPGRKSILREWQKNPLFKKLKAAKTGNIISLDQNLWGRYRGLISAELQAKQLLEGLKALQAKKSN